MLKRRELEFMGNCLNSTLKKQTVTKTFLNQKQSKGYQFGKWSRKLRFDLGEDKGCVISL